MSQNRIKDERSPESRNWEEFYRNRWQYDKVVRSTHGVNCTGGCSWMVHVKDGIVGWELQANVTRSSTAPSRTTSRAAAPGGSATPGTSTARCG